MPRRRVTWQRELTDEEELDLLGWGDPAFETDEDRRAAWEEHKADFSGYRGGLPGTRPRAFWEYTPGAPDEDDYLIPAPWAGRGGHPEDAMFVDSDAWWETCIRFLAARGELSDHELQLLADDIEKKATWVPEAQEAARRLLDAALEGLAERNQRDNDPDVAH